MVSLLFDLIFLLVFIFMHVLDIIFVFPIVCLYCYAFVFSVNYFALAALVFAGVMNCGFWFLLLGVVLFPMLLTAAFLLLCTLFSRYGTCTNLLLLVDTFESRFYLSYVLFCD